MNNIAVEIISNLLQKFETATLAFILKNYK